MIRDLKGQVAIVTGAAQGIGAAISKELATSGAYVAMVDRQSSVLDQQVDEFKKEDLSVESFVGDILDQKFLNDLYKQLLSKKKTIDILVNNAGIIRDNFLTNITEQDWDDVLDVNLKGAFLTIKEMVPIMKENQKGKIVNIISRSWLGNVGQANYSASKGGLVSLTRTLALELARYQIHVNAVSPGLIDTPMTKSMPEKARQQLINMQPTKKMGEPKDIAAAVSFLSSESANFISGQVLHVDGGKSCGLLSL